MTVNPRQSFKLKLVLSIFIAALLSFSLIFSAATYFTNREIRSNVYTIVTSKLAIATMAMNAELDNFPDLNSVVDSLSDKNLCVLSDSLQSLRPYPSSKLYIVDPKGFYVANPDHSLIRQPVPSDLLDFVNSDDIYYAVKDKVGKELYYFHSESDLYGAKVLMSVPSTDVIAEPRKMMIFILIDMLLGLILLLGGSLFVINHLTKPLEKFAEAARKIAHGDFHVELPVVKDHNELYDLRAALASMEVSLDRYVKKLEVTSGKKAAMEKELDIARNIQLSMVPMVFPPYPDRDNLDIFASLTPAQAVGGDLYDYLLCGDKFFFCIGDVSGKGVPASMYMAVTRTLFRSSASADRTPAQVASAINDMLSEGNDMGMFVTMLIASFDLKTGELLMCNCGHNLPATNAEIVDPETMRCEPRAEYHLIKLLPTNIAIGVMKGFDYEEIKMTVAPGCSLLLYTDGVTEAANSANELYDETRMLESLRSHKADASSKRIVESLVADVKKFTGDAAQSDDITALCIRCNKLG